MVIVFTKLKRINTKTIFKTGSKNVFKFCYNKDYRGTPKSIGLVSEKMES